MAAADEPIRIDPEILNEHHEGALTKLFGLRFVEATKDRLVAELTVRDDLTTVGGRVHGGTLMALADLVGATGTFLNLPPGATGTTTLESKTNFFAAGREGVIRTESTPAPPGRTTQVWQTRVTDASGRLLSMTIQTQLVLRD
jgi:1,4-dihydroxy-2-naphthoyl-CoA hydrolase